MIGLSQNKALGFSLIEVLVVVSIFLILSSVALPNYTQYTANNKAAQYANELMISLKVARSTAVTEHKNVIVCSIQNGMPSLTCDNSASSWRKGWYVYSSTKVYKVVQFTTNAQPINTGITTNKTAPITFSEDGLVSPSGYVITIAPSGCTTGYQVTVGTGGIIRKSPVSC